MITLLNGAPAREAVLGGMKKIYDAVSASMGPSGRNLLFDFNDNQHLTKDGATIAKWIAGSLLADKFESLGAQLLRKASMKAEEDAGDGTTAATVFGYRLSEYGKKFVDEGYNVIGLKKGMEIALDFVIKHLDSIARPAATREDWKRVALVSSREEEIAEMIAEAMEKVGPSGHVRVEKGDDWQDHEMKLEIKEGMSFDRGYLTEACVNNRKKWACKLEKVPVIVTDIKLYSERHYAMLQAIMKDIVFSKMGQRKLVIIGLQFEGVVKEWIIQSNMLYQRSNGTDNACILAIESPGFGTSFTEEFCGDIAALTGATLISESTGVTLERFTQDRLGSAEIVETTKHESRIVNSGENEAVKQRIADIESKMKEEKGELLQKKLEDRKAMLTTGMAVIEVGGHTDLNIMERKDRVEDAVLATQCAYKEGVVPGGGMAFLSARAALMSLHNGNRHIEQGIRIVEEVLKAPFIQIADNCGVLPDELDDLVKEAEKLETWKGYDASANFEVVVDMNDKGILDPAKVCKTAIRYGIEIATMLLTTESVAVTIPLDNQGNPIFELIRGDAADAVQERFKK